MMSTYTHNYRNKAPVKEWASIRLARSEDIPAIQNIYKEVYKGTYSYLEYLDAGFLRNDMSCGHTSWYLVEDIARHAISGCVSFTVDLTNWRAYTRGMMMRPAWQGRRGNTRTLASAYQHFLSTYNNQLRIVWGEARSMSVKPQLVAESVGMIPLGILPGKDLFFEKRETAIIMAVYSSLAWQTREPKVQLIPSLIHLHDYAKSVFKPMRNDNIGICEEEINCTNPRNTDINILQIEKSFGYTTYNFKIENTDEFLSIDVNRQCANAEHMEMHCSDPVRAYYLLDCMVRHFKNNGIRYIEGHCPANKPQMQQAFTNAGMQPLGYLPAWYLDSEINRYVDHVVFGWIQAPVPVSTIEFSTKATSLVQMLANDRGMIP